MVFIVYKGGDSSKRHYESNHIVKYKQSPTSNKIRGAHEFIYKTPLLIEEFFGVISKFVKT